MSKPQSISNKARHLPRIGLVEELAAPITCSVAGSDVGDGRMDN